MEQASWTPFKDLWNTTQEFALQNSQSSFHKLKSLLRKHKPEFLSLLKNTAPNSEHRNKVRNANTVGLPLVGEGASGKLLEEAFIEESLILSDLFQLNEFSSVELLLAAEQQVPNYPNYSRGLVAVLLYWDGRRNLVNILKTLIQCRRGRTWTLDLPQDAVNLATTFTNELVESGLTKQILKLLVEIQVETEMEKLGKQRGLGGAKHRKQVRDLITEIRQCLSECLFYLAGQSGLSANDAVDIIRHLQKNVDSEADGKLAASTLALVFTVLYSFLLPCDAQADSDVESIEELLQHPLLSDKKFLPLVQKVLYQECGHAGSWKVIGIKACLQLGWAISLRTVSQIPSQIFTGSKVLQPNADILEQDENILEACLAEKAFLFIKKNIVSGLGFHTEEFYLRRIHGLITDLIVNMPLKIKDMRNHGDEVARIIMLHLVAGEEPPPECRKDFEQLMQLITCVYNKDPLDLQLSIEFWSPNESVMVGDAGTFVQSPNKTHQRLSHKQMALFKFIRQSGDLLPPLLYIPYLHMLAALSTGSRSARVAFEMLKANGVNIGGNGESSTVSWDHFFMSCQQYYNNLRQDRPIHDVTNPFAMQHHQHAAQVVQPRSITPQEVEGLQAVMRLIAKILQYDEIACITVYEHSQWSSCAVLFGLLQCPIPVGLKGDILNVLTQLARIPDIAMGVLQAMDSAQFLQTVPDSWSGSAKSAGLLSELEEVEAREEEFPMSRGFLKLLGTLTESGASLSILGEGTRAPGFDPYLSFAIESVFLKFNSRSYIRPEEKWEVASSSLRLFNNLLLQYQPHPEHFGADKAVFGMDSMTQQSSFLHDSTVRSSVTSPRGGKVPGFSLLLYIYNEGNFFKMVMHIIADCITYLDKYTSQPCVEATLVEAASLAMQLLYNALQLQDAFLSSMRESGKPLLITTLDKLLLGVNTKTGKADYIVSIAKFVVHNTTHSQLGLLATKIVSWLCFSSVMTHREVVMVMMNSCGLMTRQKILHGFVEVLDTVCPELDENDDDSASHQSQCRLALLRLLVYCIDLPSPNLSQFLLGFDITKPTSSTSLQDPGIMSTPRSCLHSVLTILSLGMDANGQQASGHPLAITETPKLAELCYQLLYRLSANAETTGPVMRYLRSSYDFVYKHLQLLPFTTQDLEQPSNNHLMQQAWLLKMTAIELYSLSAKQQRTNAQRIIQLLFQHQARMAFGNKTMNSTSLFGQSFDPRNTTVRSMIGDRSDVTSSSFLNVTDGVSPRGSGTEQMKILQMLDVLDFAQDFPTALSLDQFVPTVVEQAIKSCETTNEHGVQYCDIKALHELLKATLGTLTATDDVTRRQLASQDVQKILNTAVERNKTRETVHAKLSFLSAWRHTLEISLTACPVDLFATATRQQALLEIAQHLTNRVRQSDAVQELTSPVAGVILTLVMQIRSCFINQKSLGNSNFFDNGQLSQLLNAENEKEIDLNDIAPLQVVIRGVVEWLLQSGISEKVRTHLYAAFLYYMQMCRRPTSNKTGRREITGILASLEDSYSKINRENFRLIRDYGDSFINLISKDACTGQSVCRVLALACLDSIVQIDSQQIWLQHMVKNGSLSHIAHSIAAEDESLQQYLNPTSEPLRAVYIYEQKMALLCAIVQTTSGARATIESGLLARLTECSFLDLRPSAENEEFNALLPGVLGRYRQLLIPALQFCASLLTTLGGSNHYEASALILQFLLAHADSIINAVLRISSIPTDIQALTELKLVTSILSQTAAQDYSDPTMFGNVPQGHLAEIQGHMLRIQRQLLSLLPHLFPSDPTLNEMQREAQNENKDLDFQQVSSLLHEIGGNVLAYCRAVALRSSDVTDSSVLLFAPDLSETASVAYGTEDFRSQSALGVLLRILRTISARYSARNEEQKREKWKLDNVNTLGAQDLKEIVNAASEQLSLTQEQDLASAILRKRIRQKTSHLKCLYYIIENCLLLLWQHLDYYVLRAEPLEAPNSNILFPSKGRSESFSRGSLRRLQDISNFGADSSFADSEVVSGSQIFGKQIGIRRADVDKLKRELPSSLPDHFLQKIGQIEVEARAGGGDFVQPLIRRVQHIVKLHASAVN
uniref:Nuclear pore complex protein Nup205-like n=1 Tax=Phallusia mammillata TaxID=59560 RepID=A0A6F9DND2_9ASCI|nr:nuclear pore complex protein Nup205-like [Phallusia mammillata]